MHGAVPVPAPASSAAAAADVEALREELSRREDLYHAACPAATPEAFEQVVAPEFWEIGASGRPYTRAFCLQVLSQRGARPAADGWRVREARAQRLGADHALLVYTLEQPGRTTLRSTLWRRSERGWLAVFHQGTVIQP
ncbi:DUF4440 domain-containing protein [Xenophilus sp. Marseille-Q4582]|uniref:nuclear transport factor 2 family protein n=1 Tax=Xenophilus sp. Marseille-Q4582 TaxID=2866600 RepID=UPI001CE46CE7|nr:DUF4440 domain-containing protein [Xenophilus sp. Marseille-Q4582]